MNAVRSDSVDFFLGTTTPAGFKGYFEPLRREPGMQMYLIKSGPGCGKSTLMKRLAVKAEQKGEPIQRIHCASDPDSLDGVIFLDKRAAIVDATAPHVMEPDAPGAEEQVVSLYHTLDADALHAHADEVKVLKNMENLINNFILTTEGPDIPAGEAYFEAENPKGALGFFIISNGGGVPYRVKIRAPSFVSLCAMQELIPGHHISDVPIILGSMDFVLGECDR